MKRKLSSFFFILLTGVLIFFLVSFTQAQPKTESEPNNQMEQADELRLGESVEGHLQNERDVDWYKLIIDKPGKNIIHIDLSGVPEIDTFLIFSDVDGNTLKSADRTREGEPESIVNVGVTEGIYHISLYGSGTNDKDSYTLSVQQDRSWERGYEFEPNDKVEQANEIRLNESIKGFFDDGDFFKLAIQEPGKNIIRISLTAVSGVDSSMEILNEEGRLIKNADSAPEGQPEEIVNFGVQKGIYYITVYGSHINFKEEYTLSVQEIGPWKEGYEFEPNDDRERANVLQLGEEIKGYANPYEDADWYAITMPTSGVDIWIIELSGISRVNSHLELFDEEGNLLKESDLTEEGGEEMLVRMKVPGGKHFISVGFGSGSSEELYTLRTEKWKKPPADPEEIRQALRKALDYLASEQTPEGYWLGEYEENAGIAGLCLMAFLGADCVEKDYSTQIARAIEFLKSKYHPSSDYESGTKDQAFYGGLIGEDYHMYEHAIATLALVEALVYLNDFSLEPIVKEALQLIARAQNTEYKPESLGGPVPSDSSEYGGWRYRPDSTDSDISVTGWQILALIAAMNAGLSIPDWCLPKAADYIRACSYEEEGSFAYTAGSGSTGCARTGIGALCLQLAGYPDDPLIPPALRYMQDNPPIWEYEDPGEGYPFYYWYYGTRAMINAGGDDAHIWKKWMCRLLVDNQNETGSWDGAQKEEDMEIYTTALGALMLELCCGHVPIYMQKKIKRPGLLEIRFEEGTEKETAKNVELILDASNSMWGQIQGESKIVIARKVLAQIIQGLPEGIHVSLRLYGHRYPLKDSRACKDTELVIPIGPIAKDDLIATINRIQPRGKTPLVFSVLQAVKDFDTVQRGSIILITDGIESCGGNIQSIAQALKKSGLDLRVHIVGFDIKEAQARKQLQAMAESTDGTYLDARDAEGLLSSLQQTLQIEYEILDKKGNVLAKGFAGGEPVRIMEGKYRLRVMVEPEPLETSLTIQSGKKVVLLLKKINNTWEIERQE